MTGGREELLEVSSGVWVRPSLVTAVSVESAAGCFQTIVRSGGEARFVWEFTGEGAEKSAMDLAADVAARVSCLGHDRGGRLDFLARRGLPRAMAAGEQAGEDGTDGAGGT